MKTFEEMSIGDIVSIIIPVYNVALLLRRCLNSVCSQTYPYLELILVDDGSTDGSGAICDEYALRDSRVKVIHQENKGLSAARNSGIRRATGQWVLYVDSDDFIDENYIEKLLQASKRTGADVIVSSYMQNHVDENGELLNSPLHEYIALDCRPYLPEQAIIELLSEKRISTSAWGKLARRTLWEGIKFPEGRNFEDLPCSWKLLARAKSVAIVDDPIYHYVKRKQSITKSPSVRSICDYDRSISQINNELPYVYQSKRVRRALAFRVCLEYSRCLEMIYQIGSKTNTVLAIRAKALGVIRRCAVSAFHNSRSPIAQRIRIVLMALVPDVAIQLRSRVGEKGLN